MKNYAVRSRHAHSATVIGIATVPGRVNDVVRDASEAASTGPTRAKVTKSRHNGFSRRTGMDGRSRRP